MFVNYRQNKNYIQFCHYLKTLGHVLAHYTKKDLYEKKSH